MLEALKVIILGLVEGNHRMVADQQYRSSDPGGRIYSSEIQ